MSKKIAAIILQRNMPEATKKILDCLTPVNPEVDYYVVESGSDDDKVIQWQNHFNIPDERVYVFYKSSTVKEIKSYD